MIRLGASEASTCTVGAIRSELPKDGVRAGTRVAGAFNVGCPPEPEPEPLLLRAVGVTLVGCAA
jgi:hypothetical protein